MAAAVSHQAAARPAMQRSSAAQQRPELGPPREKHCGRGKAGGGGWEARQAAWDAALLRSQATCSGYLQT